MIAFRVEVCGAVLLTYYVLPVTGLYGVTFCPTMPRPLFFLNWDILTRVKFTTFLKLELMMVLDVNVPQSLNAFPYTALVR